MSLGEVLEDGEWRPLRSLEEILPDVLVSMEEARREAIEYDRELALDEPRMNGARI